MARPYRSEISELPLTIEWVSSVDITELSSAVARGWSSPLVSVGSGGSFSAASHLAHLHRSLSGEIAIATTPFQLASEPIASAASHWIFSAGGSNVDVVTAVQASELGEPIAVNVVTMKKRSKVADICRQNPFLGLHVLTTPSKKDGFLATNSLLAFCALMTRCYLNVSGRLNDWLPIAESLTSLADPGNRTVTEWLENSTQISAVDHLIVLYGRDTGLGGLDIESKFVEAGIKNIQLADYRHFAHGRHHWLAKHPDTSGVLALKSDADNRLAGQTMRLVPAGIPRALIEISGSGELAQLTSLLAAFHLTAQIGFAQGIDPGQPGVPDFGRKIYGLRIPTPVAPPVAAVAIRRKMNAAGVNTLQESQVWDEALKGVSDKLSAAKLSGIVLDYDGTVVDTDHRFEPPGPELSATLGKLIVDGVPVGIATGRGRSAGDSLRAVLPKSLWPRVVMGYYNGAEIITLDHVDGPDRDGAPTRTIAELQEILQSRLQIMPPMTVDLRPRQLTLTPAQGTTEEALWIDLRELIDEHRMVDVRLMRSSHSIDVIDRSASKLNVVNVVGASETVLRIGDRGRWPGNDFELLAHPLGLSVDQVSTHPDECWNLAPAGTRGARATLYYLAAVTMEDGPRIRLSLQ